jgi:hypothetical protein
MILLKMFSAECFMFSELSAMPLMTDFNRVERFYSGGNPPEKAISRVMAPDKLNSYPYQQINDPQTSEADVFQGGRRY